MSSFHFGPLNIDVIAHDAAVAHVRALVAAEEPSLVVTSNINHLRWARASPDFRRVVRRAALNVADGWPLVVASRVFEPRVPERIAGVDLVAHLLQTYRGLRVALLGGAPSAAERMAAWVGQTHDVVLIDGLDPAVWRREGGVDDLIERLRLARPNLVLLGIGVPNQELLAERLLVAVDGPIICCGATIDFLSGLARRAPVFVRRLGLEWAYRMVREPRRLAGRYVHSGGVFVLECMREALRRRFA